MPIYIDNILEKLKIVHIFFSFGDETPDPVGRLHPGHQD